MSQWIRIILLGVALVAVVRAIQYLNTSKAEHNPMVKTLLGDPTLPGPEGEAEAIKEEAPPSESEKKTPSPASTP